VNVINLAASFPARFTLRAKSAAALPLRFWREVGARPEVRSFAERAGRGTHRLPGTSGVAIDKTGKRSLH